MTYNKPSIVELAKAIDAVQESGFGKILDPDVLTPAGAYEVDE